MSRRADAVTGSRVAVRGSEFDSGVGPASAFRRHATEANIPELAIWLPRQGQWIGVRVRYGFLPCPQAALLWVWVASAGQLCAELKRAERQLEIELRERVRKPWLVEPS